MSYAENFPAGTPDRVIGAVNTVEKIVSGMVNGRNPVTSKIRKDIVHAVVLMRVPRILGIPLKISEFEKEVDRLSYWHSGDNH